jgi:hypothetical protein
MGRCFRVGREAETALVAARWMESDRDSRVGPPRRAAPRDGSCWRATARIGAQRRPSERALFGRRAMVYVVGRRLASSRTAGVPLACSAAVLQGFLVPGDDV